MTWRTEKTEEGFDFVWDGVEAGIAPSPLKGTANIQNANISTESGEVLASFGRTAQQQAAIVNGTLTPDGATLFNAPASLKAGTWISVSASTVTSISTTTTPTTVSVDYLIVGGGGSGGGVYENGSSGGGGAGEYIYGSTTFAVGTFAVTVGVGGTQTNTGLTRIGGSGTSSSFASLGTADGGGGGGMSAQGISPSSVLNGLSGGSGGGGGGNDSVSGTGGSNTGGYNGGNGFSSGTVNLQAGGGGGGSAAAGTNGASGTGGAGGAGTSNSISGTAVFYAAGGGGGGNGGSAGGSSGAGGGGSYGNNGGTATTPGSGGGGTGSSSTQSFLGGAGADGVVIVSYTTGTAVCSGGTITQIGTKTIHTFTENGTFVVHAVAQTNFYYVSYSVGGKIKLSAKYDPYEANEITHGTTGSVTFSTVAVPGAGIAKFTEKYGTATTTEYRYYVLDNNSRTWVYDTGVFDANGTTWMLPDPSNYSVLNFTGMAVLNGWLFNINCEQLFAKPTVNLGSLLSGVNNGYLSNPFPTHINYAMVGTQGKMYYTDLNYLGEVYPTTSLLTSLANIQSYGKYTASTTTGTISELIGGSLPYTQDANGATARIPAVFFTDVYGAQPTNLVGGTVYWIEYNPAASTFGVYAAQTGGSAINIASGATGNQYFNTFDILGSGGINGASATVQFSQQRINLPYDEVAQSLVEIGNTVIIGGKTNTLYPWNQVDALPSDVIKLPENDVKTMINVNNMAYVFAGSKGNIYITNGSVASLALKIPDYCAGVPGTPNTYIEPIFTWFDAAYVRGRVYCSVLDQTATKAGNCGGVWSFVPSQNMSAADVGNALRLENQNSYADYDGAARLIIANEEQTTNAPQYWTWWQDSHSIGTSAFGIDTTASTPVTSFVIETDLLPTGTLLSKDTFSQLEYKLTAPAVSGDAVQMFYRLNANGAWTSCGTAEVETSDPLSGYFPVAFQKTQWVQFRAVCATGGTTASSFTRLSQIRLR